MCHNSLQFSRVYAHNKSVGKYETRCRKLSIYQSRYLSIYLSTLGIRLSPTSLPNCLSGKTISFVFGVSPSMKIGLIKPIRGRELGKAQNNHIQHPNFDPQKKCKNNCMCNSNINILNNLFFVSPTTLCLWGADGKKHLIMIIT